MPSDEFEIYVKAIESWGIGIQLDVLMEECAELIQECSKFKRILYHGEEPNKEETIRMIGEMVDTQTMINQIKYGYIIKNNPDMLPWFGAKKASILEKVSKWLEESDS